MNPKIRLQRITDADFDNSKLHAWCAFSDNNASKAPPIGEFDKNNRPLQNLTVGVKDIIDVAGLPTRCGSAIYANAPPALVDAACVSLMRAAGAVIVGKTVTTEFATFVPSETRNPVNLEYSPGGSSAGSAAAVAAGHVDIAIGTQTAGSILRPAAYCGVFGFKPSFDLVPRIGVKVQSESLDTVGVFARDIKHCAAWLEAMTGEATLSEDLSDKDQRRLKIGCVTNWLEHASADMRETIAHAKHCLTNAGHDVVDLTLPAPLDEIIEHQKTIQYYESARAYHAEITQYRTLLTAALAVALDEGAAIPRDRYLNAMAAAENARVIADQLFEDWDVWLMPSAPGAAPHGLTSTGDALFNRLASVLHTPAINVPVYRANDGMPFGLQLIGGRGTDGALVMTVTSLINCPRTRHRVSSWPDGNSQNV